MIIHKLRAALSYAAIYSTIHFAVTAEKLIAEESGVVKLQSADCVSIAKMSPLTAML